MHLTAAVALSLVLVGGMTAQSAQPSSAVLEAGDDADFWSGVVRGPDGDGLDVGVTDVNAGQPGRDSKDRLDEQVSNQVAPSKELIDAIGVCDSPRLNWLDPCDVYDDPEPGEPDVTLADVARFLAAQPALTGDPVGFGLLNAPANVIATATEQAYTGELFNRPVEVRFVPVGYTFDYGDGGSRTSGTGGATWDDLGVAQFTPTETTHVYRERATFTVTVTVAYAPFVNFGSGWRAVAGTVSATSGGYPIQIVEARTALVARDCLEDPSGVGCPTG